MGLTVKKKNAPVEMDKKVRRSTDEARARIHIGAKMAKLVWPDILIQTMKGEHVLSVPKIDGAYLDAYMLALIPVNELARLVDLNVGDALLESDVAAVILPDIENVRARITQSPNPEAAYE